jgi:DNA processing protein
MKIIKNTDYNYPKSLLNIKKPPSKLYVEGNDKLLNNTSLAIVGSRKCSEYGIKYAKEFAKTIADNNITIVSGLASGIDSVAHFTATNTIGNTIAVVGCGLNYVYPEENKELFDEILKNNGCIISEYEPDTEVNMSNFPKRNRIISGLSKGVLVIEAGYRSGSTITARYGFEQNKKVFCLPRNIGEKNGIGSNELIKKGAILVTSPEDILEEFGIANTHKEEYAEKEENRKIKKEYKTIFDLILYTPTNIQYISKKSGLKISEVNEKLTILELEGQIKSLPGNNYVRI